MKWSQRAWHAIMPIYEKTIALPFIQELAHGTLPNEKFVFYIQQDALYLADYGNVLKTLATRLTKPEHINTFHNFVHENLAAENELHRTFFAELHAVQAQTPSPTCLLYTSFLLRQWRAPPEVMAAAVLPCFWIYHEVGKTIFANQTQKVNPYQAWVNTYGGKSYAQSVKTAIAICDELAASCSELQQQAMTAAFMTSAKLEWMFWDSAYHLETWKIQ